MRAWLASAILTASLVAAASASAAREPYKLGPGDVLSVTVWNHPELSIERLAVSPDGRVSYPLTGQIDVEGMTASELETRLREALVAELAEPRVAVNIVQARTDAVYVTGAVGQPALVPWTDEMTALKALARAGGVRPDVSAADLLIVSPDGRTTSVALGREGVPEDEGVLGLSLEPGSTLVVVKAELPQVGVLGQVNNPGTVTGTPGGRLTASAAVSMAGGPTEDADLDASLLVRPGGDTTPLPLGALLRGDDDAVDTELANGDIIYVPSITADVAVLGEVNAPGRFAARQGDSLDKALALAEGVTPLADTTAIKVLRGDTTLTVDLSPMLAGESTTDFTLLPGDTVVVPSQAVTVTVLGYVNEPGTYQLPKGARVTEALAEAGGVYPRLGAANRMVLLRGEGTVAHAWKVDISKVVSVKEPAINMELESGDLIFVPKISGLSIRAIAGSLWPLINLGRLVFD